MVLQDDVTDACPVALTHLQLDVSVDGLERLLQRAGQLILGDLLQLQVDEDNRHLSHLRQILQRLMLIQLQSNNVQKPLCVVSSLATLQKSDH